jgi:sugar phosphate isomerase/epimerase
MDVGLTVGDSIERLEATGDGFAFVELSVGESALVPAETDESRIRGALETVDADLCVHLPFDQVVATTIPQIDDAIVDYQSELLEWAGSLGASKGVLHATMRNPHDTDQRPVFADQLSAIAAAGADAGVEVVVENVGHQPRGVQLSVLGDIAQETGTAVCFDVGHAYMEDGDDGVDRFLGEYADLVSHLHVHDARGRGDTHLPLGAGEIDYGLVTEHLAGFDGTVAVEVFTDDVPLLVDSARRVTAFLDGSE